MKNLYCSISRETIELRQQIAKSGEGEIYKTSKARLLAKIYHLCDEEKVNKLKVMVRYPPCDPTAPQHVSIAWPKDLLEDDHGRCVGFLMTEVERGKTLINVYHPSRRAKNAKGFNWLYLHTTALNIASSLQALHFNNYVVGDLKPDNLLVNERGLISIIDTDSFQIIDPNTQKVYYCPVSSEEFTPQEMFGKDLRVIERTEFQDCFGLAVIIWLLLFGYHPFKGKWIGNGEPLNTNELIHHGYWMYGANSKVEPVDSAIPLDILHPLLQQFFYQCFDQGHNNPAARPSAASWVTALDAARQELQQCSIEPEHYYATSYGKCYWCLRKQQYGGYDYFPATSHSRVSSSVKNSVSNSQRNVTNTSNPSTSASQSTTTSQTILANSNSQQFISVQPIASTTQPSTNKIYKQKLFIPSPLLFKRVFRFGILSGIALAALGGIVAVASDFQKLSNIERSLKQSYAFNDAKNYDACKVNAKDALDIYSKILIMRRRDLYDSAKSIESKCQIAEDSKHLTNARNFVENGMYLKAIEEALKVTSSDEILYSKAQDLTRDSINLIINTAKGKYDSGNFQISIDTITSLLDILPKESEFYDYVNGIIGELKVAWNNDTERLGTAQAKLEVCEDLPGIRNLAHSLTTSFYKRKAAQLLSGARKCEEIAVIKGTWLVQFGANESHEGILHIDGASSTLVVSFGQGEMVKQSISIQQEKEGEIILKGSNPVDIHTGKSRSSYNADSIYVKVGDGSITSANTCDTANSCSSMFFERMEIPPKNEKLLLADYEELFGIWKTVKIEDIPKITFPLPKCGDSDPPGSQTWYPVFVNQKEKFETVQQQYCRDAFLNRRDEQGIVSIQVASFRSLKVAKEFSDLLTKAIGNSEVGEPTNH